MNKDVRRFVARVNAVPGVEVITGKTHLRVMKDGKLVTTIPKTPSDHRWEMNCLTVLRRHGITPRAEPQKTTAIKPGPDPQRVRDSLRPIWENPRRGAKVAFARYVQQYAEANGLKGFASVEAAAVSLANFATGKTKKMHEQQLFLLAEALPHYPRPDHQSWEEATTAPKEPVIPTTVTVSISVDALVAALANLGITIEVRTDS